MHMDRQREFRSTCERPSMPTARCPLGRLELPADHAHPGALILQPYVAIVMVRGFGAPRRHAGNT